MRIGTVYFKVSGIEAAAEFWRAFLDMAPTKAFPEWIEFRVGGLNLGLLRLDIEAGRAQCVPVFEFADNEVVAAIARAKALGATAVLEGKDHPDYPRTAAVLVDPFGNEFEVTNLHD